MIGIFDSGHGGLTIYRALKERFPLQELIYLGDHARVPYGNRSSEEIVALTEKGATALFALGCKLVILGCNTATAIACRTLQQQWLSAQKQKGKWQSHNIIGIIAPTVEAATQTAWGITTPQYPQKYNSDHIALFATERTIESQVYREEIKKRCPKVEIINQACPHLASAIECAAPLNELDEIVKTYVEEMQQKIGAQSARDQSLPHSAILGCTHYPLVEDLFKRHLPAHTRLLSQPQIVADSLDDYLSRHSEFAAKGFKKQQPILLTTGDVQQANDSLGPFWPEAPSFQPLFL